MKKCDCNKLSEGFDNFISSVILVICLPLLPLLLELLSTRKILGSSAALTASFFALALGATSKIKSLFALSILNGVIFSSTYVISTQSNINNIQYYSFVSIFLFSAMHLYERYVRHEKDKEPFLDVWHGKEECEREGRKRRENIELFKTEINMINKEIDSLKIKKKEKEDKVTGILEKGGREQDVDSYNKEIKNINDEIENKEKEMKSKQDEIEKISDEIKKMGNKSC